MQPWKPAGKKAERGRRSAPLLSLLQIGFPLKEQRHPTTSPVRNKTKLLSVELRVRSGQDPLYFWGGGYSIKHADEDDKEQPFASPVHQNTLCYKCAIMCKVISHTAGGHSSCGEPAVSSVFNSTSKFNTAWQPLDVSAALVVVKRGSWGQSLLSR